MRKRISKGPENLVIPLLSVAKISKLYNYHPNTIRAWVHRDELPCIKHGVGGKIFIRKDRLIAFLKQWYEYSGDCKINNMKEGEER